MYYKHNIGAYSNNSCCCGETISIECDECVSVALDFQQAWFSRKSYWT